MSVMLTTIDNPFDPFTQFDDWYAFDEQQGYHTCAYLAHVARTSNELTSEEQDAAVAIAIDDIIRVNGLGLYKKVEENDEFFKKEKEIDKSLI